MKWERKSQKSRQNKNQVLEMFENIPKAVAGVAVIVSLIAGGTGAWGAITSPEKHEVKSIEFDVEELRAEIRALKIWNEALRERTLALLMANGIKTEKIEFEGFLLDVESGEIEPLSPKKQEDTMKGVRKRS